ncbi:hypothetical protein ABIC07_006076 [Bradyrhizobium sp. RT9a]
MDARRAVKAARATIRPLMENGCKKQLRLDIAFESETKDGSHRHIDRN